MAHKQDPIKRLMSHVSISPDGCWIWTAHVKASGYGQSWNEGKPISAHRLAYSVLVGPIPDGFTIDHLCRNRRCVNPEHLEAVTMRQNVLRGTAPPALNARKTHCQNGHEFTPSNTYVAAYGSRDACRICRTCSGYSGNGSVSDQNRAKTHCQNGHEFTPSNTYVDRRGHRTCRICFRAWKRAHYKPTGNPIGRPKSPKS